MADRRPAVAFAHQRLILRAMVHAEDFADGAHVLVGADELFAMRMVCGHSGRQLAPVLDVQQHPRHEPAHRVWAAIRTKRTHAPTRQMVDRRHPAFVVYFAHSINLKGGSAVAQGSQFREMIAYDPDAASKTRRHRRGTAAKAV